MPLSERSHLEIELTKKSFTRKGGCIAPGKVRYANDEALQACIQRLEALEEDTKDNSAWGDRNKEAEKKEIYDLMKKIRQSNTGEPKKTWFQALCALGESIFLPKNIKKNIVIMAVAVAAVVIFNTVVVPALAAAGIGLSAGMMGGALGLVLVTGPFGLGALAGIAIGAACLFAGCKLLETAYNGLKSFTSWVMGTGKQSRAQAASKEVKAAHASMVKKHGLSPLGGSPNPSNITVNVVSPSSNTNSNPIDPSIKYRK